ncbi:MAG TPA: hypothetical protein VFE58_10075 [Tepidisphaeraceae bacterium]|jgi:hypothetical protein|nr:hypothetical protein [Tepidisphaeraceae bacterium]
MFRFIKHERQNTRRGRSRQAGRVGFGLEILEGRQLMSASLGGFHGGGPGPEGFGPGGQGHQLSPIEFSQLPAAVQTGLDMLATNDGLADPAATAAVTLGNVNGIETYSVTINGTGTVARLTVDASGAAVTAPTVATSTWDALSGTSTGSNATAASEITSIATALGLTAPTSTTSVKVTTASDGTTTYSVTLDSSSTTGRYGSRGTTITVDSSGNPVGNQVLPFSVIPTTIQTALNANVPSGATALTTDSTQSVRVQTVDGVALYSTTFNTSGTQTTVTVNAAGTLTSLPSTSSTTYGDLSSTVQAELQTLATAGGSTETLASDQAVTVLNEANGTTIYSLSVDVAVGSSTMTRSLTVSVDANGNPTVTPVGAAGGDDRGFGGGGGGGIACGGMDDDSSSSSSSSSSASSTTASSASTAAVSAAKKASTKAVTSKAKAKAVVKTVKAKVKKAIKKLASKVKTTTA